MLTSVSILNSIPIIFKAYSCITKFKESKSHFHTDFPNVYSNALPSRHLPAQS